MITLSYTADQYCIRHATEPAATEHTCFIARNFLPENAQKLLSSLLIFGETENHVYPLNARQNHDVSLIFQKLRSENDSGYIFSEQLTKTYLLELVHFMTKLHFQTHPYARTSVN
jgi:AraC family transcriptional activator of pobA